MDIDRTAYGDRTAEPARRGVKRIMDRQDEKVRMALEFSGCVQGVGFRYRMCQAARKFNLTGWVRNEPDGRVTAEVQGSRRAIDAMLGMVGSSPYIVMDRVKSEELPLRPEEHFFDIRE